MAAIGSVTGRNDGLAGGCQYVEMRPQIARGAEGLLFGPPFSIAGELPISFSNMASVASVSWLSNRITVAASTAYRRSGES